VNPKVIDLVLYLQAIKDVDDSAYLTPSQRIQIFKEMKYELPPEMICHLCGHTRGILETLLKDKSSDGNQAKKKTTRKSTPEAKDLPEESDTQKQSLLFDTDVHPRGESVEKGVVKQAAKKRGKAKGGS